MGTANMMLPYLVMGITSMLLQITVLRLLLSAFSGNELDIGITLSFWLIYTGLGSYLGRKIRGRHAFAFSFLAVALLVLPTDLAIKAIRPVLSLAPGETVPFNAVILSTAFILLPLCSLIGIQFPLAVSFSGSRHAPERVYGIEALGAFAGGLLFTFVLSSRMNAFDLCIVLATVNILAAAYISGKNLVVLFSVIPLFFYFGFRDIAPILPWQGAEVVRTAESKYGEIDSIRVHGQTSIYAGGHLAFSYPDIQTEEMTVHIPMTMHPSPRKILVIGGSPGILREFLKYPVDSISFIELDPKIMDISSRLLTEKDRAVLKDRRVRVIIDDGRRFLKNLNTRDIDMIILNLPPPYTAGINRFYTADFFREAADVLKRDGLLVLHLPPSFGYIGRSMQTANGSLYNSLQAVFRHVEVTSEEYGDMFASVGRIDTDPASLEKTFAARGIKTEYFHPYLFRDALNPFNTDYVKQRLGRISLINTDLRPSAYLYNLMLWEEISGGRLIRPIMDLRSWHVLFFLLLVLAASAFFIFRKKRPVVYFSLFTSGFSGMSFVLAVILTYQALYGYVYEMIGLLAAMFMIGLWTGTLLKRYRIKPITMVLLMELSTIILALCSPLFFRFEPFFYALVFLSGVITGSQFSAANRAMGNPDDAGKLYGIDLAGSFSGAFISSIILIPLFGVYAALYGIAAIKAFSAFMVWSVRES